MTDAQGAQTLPKARAVEAMVEATADVKSAEKRVEALVEQSRQAQNVLVEARARLEEAKAHLDRAIEKEI